jgi:hypothetical protein
MGICENDKAKARGLQRYMGITLQHNFFVFSFVSDSLLTFLLARFGKLRKSVNKHLGSRNSVCLPNRLKGVKNGRGLRTLKA